MTIDKEGRKYRVLEAVIKTHIETASPVGSKYIACLLDLSSATIRNVMFELEREGYIKQPHTSAGRIPTDLGYRRYVDDALSYKEVPQSDILPEVMLYISEKRVSEEIIEAISCALSKITNYTGIALSPSNKLYFDGTYHMLEQPEFKELELARDFLRIIEEKNELANIMSRDLETIGITIRIGRENMFEELRECAIITATYKFRSHVSGSLGVIGPMRMKYEKIVPIVEFLAEKTTEVLEGL